MRTQRWQWRLVRDANGAQAVLAPDTDNQVCHGGVQMHTVVLAFLCLTEVVLVPIWTWLIFEEVASTRTLVGGAVLLTALLLEGVRRAAGQDKLTADES